MELTEFMGLIKQVKKPEVISFVVANELANK